jgi:LEA14-like dessication related protein
MQSAPNRSIRTPRLFRALLPVLGLVLVLGLPGCAALKHGLPRPTAKVQDVSLTDLSLSAVTLTFDVEIDNPYSPDIPLTAVTVDLASNGNSLFSGGAQAGGSIPGHGSEVVPVPVTLGFANVLKTLSGTSPGSVIPYDATVTLGFDVPALGEVTVPVTKHGEFPVPTPPSVKLERIQWQNLSPTSADGRFTLVVGNKNRFATTLSDLNYALTLGGHDLAQGSLDHQVDLAADGSNEVDFAIHVNPLQLGAAALNLLQGQNASYRLAGDMTLGSKFGSFHAPLDEQGTVPLLR